MYDFETIARRERVTEAWRVAGRTDRPRFSAPVWFALGPDPENQLGERVQDFWNQDVDELRLVRRPPTPTRSIERVTCSVSTPPLPA